MKALVLLGCPETPSQTPMAVYVFNKLTIDMPNFCIMFYYQYAFIIL